MICLSIELPDDNRIIGVIEILEKYSIDYLRFHLHSIVPPNRIKFILFNSIDKIVSELCEVVNSKYGKQDFIHQSKFELTTQDQETLRNISLK